MNYSILCFITWIIVQYISNLILLSAFDFNKVKYTRTQGACALTVLMMPAIVIKYIWFESSTVRDFTLVSVLLISIIYLHLLMKNKLWQKIMFLVLQEICFFCGEILVFTLFQVQIEQQGGFTLDNSLGYMISMTTALISLFFYLITYMMWKKIIMKRTYFGTSFLLFSLFPISQVLLTYANSQVIVNGIGINALYNIIGTIIGFVADGFLIAMMLKQQHMQETDQRLKDLQNAWTIEQNHYQEIETRREELAKIRHDLKDQLIVMQQLTLKQEYDQILTMLNTLTDYVTGTKENVYCADSVVNAIMAENEHKCEANDIALEYDLNIPMPLQMNPVVICNLFSNLFRNAIRAVCEVNDPAVPKRIMLKTTLKGNYLHIKMENPYTTPDSAGKKHSGKPDRRHYGLEILQDIAELQNGQMDVTTDNGLYVTQISLENSNQAL